MEVNFLRGKRKGVGGVMGEVVNKSIFEFVDNWKSWLSLEVRKVDGMNGALYYKYALINNF